MNSVDLILTSREIIVGLLISLAIIFVYIGFLTYLKKNGKSVHTAYKVSNTLAALAIWAELMLGNLFKLTGTKDLTYILIGTTTIAIINSLLDD